MQSGVSRLIRSNSRDLVTTWEGLPMRSFKMAYSVLVSLTSALPRLTMWVSVFSVIPPNSRTGATAAPEGLRSCTEILARSSFMAKGFVT